MKDLQVSISHIFTVTSNNMNDPLSNNEDYTYNIDGSTAHGPRYTMDGINYHSRSVEEDNVDRVSSIFEFMGEGSALNGFIASLSLIVVSELGDKTFFIAAILAMKNSRIVVFIASMLALGIMTVLASALGVAANIIPKSYIHYLSVILFVVFGLRMLKEGYDMSANEAREELDAVQSSIEKREQPTANGSIRNYSSEDPETGIINTIPEIPLKTKIKRRFLALVSLAFIQTFTMVFIAEWGDRSQISTLVLAARENFIAVTLGALLGHFLCTGLAVVGGRFIAQKISVRTGE